MNELLKAEHLSVSFFTDAGEVEAVRDVSFTVKKGEVLAIVGESGCGKSALCKSIMKLLPKTAKIKSGKILVNGADITDYTEKNMSRLRGELFSMVFQDPMTALSPLMPVGKQIAETLTLHQGLRGRAAKQRAIEILRDVGIVNPEKRYKQYPHEFSGGMRQRVVIAIAIACNPEILICDEPTTALDVTIQAQILHLLRDLQKQYGLTLIYITHDLGVVANVADRIAVMYAGDIVEIGTSDEIFFDARHPYTWALLSSLPQLGEHGKDLFAIAGTPPNLFRPVQGDAFAPRNPYALKIDFKYRPPYFDITPTHKARTWLLDPRAPHIERPACLDKIAEMGGYIHD